MVAHVKNPWIFTPRVGAIGAIDQLHPRIAMEILHRDEAWPGNVTVGEKKDHLEVFPSTYWTSILFKFHDSYGCKFRYQCANEYAVICSP